MMYTKSYSFANSLLIKLLHEKSPPKPPSQPVHDRSRRPPDALGERRIHRAPLGRQTRQRGLYRKNAQAKAHQHRHQDAELTESNRRGPQDDCDGLRALRHSRRDGISSKLYVSAFYYFRMKRTLSLVSGPNLQKSSIKYSVDFVSSLCAFVFINGFDTEAQRKDPKGREES